MNLSSEQVLAKVNQVCCQVLDNQGIQLRPETVASEVKDWDSLSHIEIVVAVEKAFQIRFNFSELQRFKNVGDMCESIVKKLPAKNQ